MSLALGEEQVPAGEDAVIARLVALQVGIMTKVGMMTAAPVRRGQHPKHHGCVDAKFVVRNDIPAPCRIGLFKEPATYAAKVRWSNGASPAKPDTDADVHGMAVKVLGVEGTPALEGSARHEQDFILIDSESFFVPDVQTMLDLMTARAMQKDEAMAEFGKKYPKVLPALAGALKKIACPSTIQYWSTVPYKLGPGAVKYTAIPSGAPPAGAAPGTSPDYLRDALGVQLAQGGPGAQYDLCVIPQASAEDPVEDPTVPWKATPIPVATLTVSPQAFDTPDRMKEAEEMSFDPWHALAEHRPLGGINRARRAVYAASLKTRQSALPV